MRESPPSSSDEKPALPVASYQEETLNGLLEALLRAERNDAALRIENLCRLTGGASPLHGRDEPVQGEAKPVLPSPLGPKPELSKAVEVFAKTIVGFQAGI